MSEEAATQRLRVLVRDAIDKKMYDTAIFFSNKLVSLTGSTADYYDLAQAYYLTNQSQRAFHLLEREGFIPKSKRCRYLAAQCQASCSQWNACVSLLLEDYPLSNETTSSGISLDAAMYLLLGQSYEALANRNSAIEAYKKALHHDAHCFEAFKILTDNHMLTSREELELVNSLKFNPETEWLRQSYLCRVKKYDPSARPNLEVLKRYKMEDNIDTITHKAEILFYHNKFRQAYNLTKELLALDPYHHGNVLVLHLSCLVELGLQSELFTCAHKLVSSNPQQAVSWYAVGCYYFLAQKYDQARRYFSKSTSCSREFGPGWLAFGHAFSVVGEQDQALAAYRAASRVMSGSHLPLLFIGTECARANDLDMARTHISQAASICDFDPLVWNELAIVEFKSRNYEEAINHLQHALKLITLEPEDDDTREKPDMVPWEPIYFNLGHCNMKLRQYEKAIEFYEEARRLVPSKASTYTALGFTFHLMGRLEKALEFYHDALARSPGDSFASKMLTKGLQEAALIEPEYIFGKGQVPPEQKADLQDLLNFNDGVCVLDFPDIPRRFSDINLSGIAEVSVDGSGSTAGGSANSSMETEHLAF